MGGKYSWKAQYLPRVEWDHERIERAGVQLPVAFSHRFEKTISKRYHTVLHRSQIPASRCVCPIHFAIVVIPFGRLQHIFRRGVLLVSKREIYILHDVFAT